MWRDEIGISERLDEMTTTSGDTTTTLLPVLITGTYWNILLKCFLHFRTTPPLLPYGQEMKRLYPMCIVVRYHELMMEAEDR
jgi:hypothetical protein